VPKFTECFSVELSSVFSKALGKQRVCRVSESLPSVFYLALGEEMICRVSDKIHSTKNITLGKTFDSGNEPRAFARSMIIWSLISMRIRMDDLTVI